MAAPTPSPRRVPPAPPPPVPTDFRKNLRALAMEVEGRCRKVRDAHFEAARMWDQVYFGLGLAAVLIGVIGGGATGSGVLGQVYPALAALFASVAGILAATTAFLKPSEHTEAHKRAGDLWASLRDRTADLYALELELPGAKDEDLKAKFEALLKEKDKISAESPVIPTWAWDRVDRWTYAPTLGPREGPATRKGKRRP